jgi:hypothetical protein
MLAPSPGIVRPLLEVTRGQVAAYARARSVPYLDDPSNLSLAHQRNRVRLELLPALERASPGFSAWCAELGGRAAAWRAQVATFVDEVIAPVPLSATQLVVPVSRVVALDTAAWQLIWPELAGRVGVVMDWRGISRASAWAPRATSGTSIPLSGGGVIQRTPATFVIHGGASPSVDDYIATG